MVYLIKSYPNRPESPAEATNRKVTPSLTWILVLAMPNDFHTTPMRRPNLLEYLQVVSSTLSIPLIVFPRGGGVCPVGYKCVLIGSR